MKYNHFSPPTVLGHYDTTVTIDSGPLDQ